MHLHAVNAWLTGIVLALVFSLAVEAGYRLHGLLFRSGPKENEQHGAGHIVSAALGLLGLLIAFTFAMAVDRYETRRHLVIAEANAIASTWQMQRLLAEPQRSELDASMQAYIKTRLAYVRAGADEARLDANAADAQAVRTRIWAQTGAALRAPGAAFYVTAIVPATAGMFAFAATRREALEETVPMTILCALIAAAMASAGVMGFGLASSAERHLPASFALFSLVAFSIALIIDLDQPRSGSIVVSQKPMERVAAAIAAAATPP